MKRGTKKDATADLDNVSTASSKKTTKPKAKAKPVAEEMITIPKEQFAALMEQMEERILKKVGSKSNDTLTEMLETMRDNNYSGSSREGMPSISMDKFDVNDVLPEPVMFFTYSIGYMIMDDVKQGHAIRTPYSRPFKFTHLFRYEKIGARDKKEFMMVSVCKISSKKELDWLQRHSLYGVKFFEDIRNVKTIDVEMQERLVEASNEIARLSDHEVVQRALAEGVAPGTDVSRMKRSLIQAIAQKRVEEKNTRVQTAYDRMQREASNVGINIAG